MREFLTEAEIAAFTSHENPMTRAQKAMLTPMPKRFYKDVSVGEADGQFQVLLDGKPVRTPAKAHLQFPTHAAAALVAAEFAAQETEINPAFMPVTRLANTVIDGVINELNAVRDEVLRYAGNDMLCYRAENPDALVMRQVEQWDPYLEWFRTRHGVRLYLTEGVIHVEQPKEALEQARIAIFKGHQPVGGSCPAHIHDIDRLGCPGARCSRRSCQCSRRVENRASGRGLDQRTMGCGLRGRSPPRQPLDRYGCCGQANESNSVNSVKSLF